MIKRTIKKLALFLAVIGLISPMISVPAFAEDSKIVKVPINKNYKSAKFTLTFEYYDDYAVVIKSPSEKEFKGTVDTNSENGNVVTCVVDDVEIGDWNVIISRPIEESLSEMVAEETEEEGEGEKDSENMPEGETGTDPIFLIDPATGLPVIDPATGLPVIAPQPTEETTEPISEPTPEVQYRSISPVKIQVEGSMENLVDVDRDITVATDIAGLRMYFKDDSFVAEWTDTTCGNVDIEVINAKNLQKLDKQTVKGNSYACPLDDSVEEIMVTFVPAVSAQVEGASNSFTFKFDNNPDAVVTYEDLVITNHDSILVTCELHDKYGVEILVNGHQVEKTEIMDQGIYDFEVPIDVGTNEISTYIVDEYGNMRSTKYSVDKDVIAPQLELVDAYEDIVTEEEYLTIEGRVDDFKKLLINNAEVEVEGDNTFKFDYKLKEGLNQIAVVASDAAGNETVYDIACERVIPEEKPIPWLKIIICAGLVGLVVVYILEVLKRKRNPEQYTKAESDEYSEYDDVDISGLTPKEKKDIRHGPNVVWDILSYAVPIIAAFIILTFVIMVSVVQSGSMEPKLRTGNTVFYNRLAYIRTIPQRGDVVVFYSDEFGSYYGKRIIGVPGDNIEFKDGYVVINGQYCDESSYIGSEVETNCSKEFTVPENCYFMLGDNRRLSNDSRYWKNPYIPREKIVGKYMGQIDFSIQYDILHKGVAEESVGGGTDPVTTSSDVVVVEE